MFQPDRYAMTHQQIADALSISPEMVGYIERKALARLRLALQRRGITAEDFNPRETDQHPLARVGE